MIQSIYQNSDLNKKISHSKLILIVLAIILLLLSLILLPLGFVLNLNIHLFGWLPLASINLILLDIFIFRHLILHNRLKSNEIEYSGKRKKITLFLLVLLVLTFLYDFIITIMKTTEFYLFRDNYFYGYICGIIIISLILFINSTDFSKVQIDTIVGGILLVFYAILISPQILSKFSLQIYPYLPANLLLRSLLSIGLTLAFFTFQRMRKAKFLHLGFLYAWIFIPFQIVNWFGFTNYYPFVVTMDLFHKNPVLLKMIHISSVIIASCLLLLIIILASFAVILFLDNSGEQMNKK
jgi:hypothetical protein